MHVEILSWSIYIVVLCSVYCEANSYHNMTSLYSIITNTGNANIRPVMDQSKPIEIRMDFNLLRIRNFDDISGELGLTGYFKIQWKDEILSWDPKKFGNITNLLIPHKGIWKPLFVSGNPHNEIQFLHHNDMEEETFVRLYYDGFVSWDTGSNFEISCSVDVSRYPFDEQKCILPIVSYNYLPTELTILPLTSGVKFDLHIPHNIWDLKDVSMQHFDWHKQFLYFHIAIKRRATFALLNLILPIFTMGILNLFVFLLPAESGERVGYAITVLLSIAVFMTITSDNLPSNSYPRIPTITFLLFADLMISVLIVVSVIIILRFYFREDQIEVPRYWKLFAKFYRFISCGCGCKRRNSKCEVYEHDHNTKPIVTWKDVGHALDFCLGLFFVCTIILVNVLYFVDVYELPLF